MLRIQSPEDLRLHASRGPIFESFVISELIKSFLHQGKEPDLYFWRDSAGHEIDAVIDLGRERVAVEVKSGETVASDSSRASTSGALWWGTPRRPPFW